MDDTSLPYAKVPLREGRTTITKPATFKTLGAFIQTADSVVYLRYADFTWYPIPAMSGWTNFPTRPFFQHSAPAVFEVCGPGSGTLIVQADEDIETTWEAPSPRGCGG